MNCCSSENRPKIPAEIGEDGESNGDKKTEEIPLPEVAPPREPEPEVEIDHVEVLKKTKVEHESAEAHRRVALKVHQLYIEKLCEVNAHTAAQIRSMKLDPISEDEVAYTMLKIDELTDQGESFASQGQCVFFVQAVTAALVPVLIGVLGSFNSKKTDDFIRLIAIALSILGTIAKAVQEVYVFRARGEMITTRCSGLNDLFHRYVALAGTDFDPRGNPDHPLNKSGGYLSSATDQNRHQIMFQTYIDKFNIELKELRRQDALMLGSAQSGGDSGSDDSGSHGGSGASGADKSSKGDPK